LGELEIPTAEPVEFTLQQARDLTDRIKAGVTNLLPLIKEAFERRVDRLMGYDSWTAYCDVELRGIRLPIEDRRAHVAELREAGMSTRAIGAALGENQSTVVRDLKATDADRISRPEVVRSLDGRERPASRPTPPPASEPEVVDPATTDAASDLVDTPVGPATRQFAEALDRLVPDPDPHAGWRQAFLKATLQLFAVARFAPDEIAEKDAGGLCFDEYRRALDVVNEHFSKTKNARAASTPDNVTPLRRTS
jgi:hypothetical protein